MPLSYKISRVERWWGPAEGWREEGSSPRVLGISSDEKKTRGGGKRSAGRETEGENRSREVVEAVSFLSLLIRHLFRANCARVSRSYWPRFVFTTLVRY